MSLHLGIGPHQGRELELMLTGVKLCAIFHDALPESGVIPEKIIPEQAFAPHVASGRFLRFAKDYKSGSHVIRYVCFTARNEEWRAQFLLWLKDRFYNGEKVDHSDEIMEGRILGYTEDEIKAFLPTNTPYL